jgi:asparagine synthase (glutamine-hydrolysing)
MPKSLKIKFLSNKYALRELAKQYLPRENLKMPKSGFGVPISKWFVREPVLRDILSELSRDGFIVQVCNRDNLCAIIRRHVDEQRDFSEFLWLITNLYLWHRQFF